MIYLINNLKIAFLDNKISNNYKYFKNSLYNKKKTLISTLKSVIHNIVISKMMILWSVKSVKQNFLLYIKNFCIMLTLVIICFAYNV